MAVVTAVVAEPVLQLAASWRLGQHLFAGICSPLMDVAVLELSTADVDSRSEKPRLL